MSDAPTPRPETLRLVSFATLGAVSTAQELAGLTLRSIEGADQTLVAEETLCLVATATARAAALGLKETPAEAGAVADVLVGLPFTFHEYIVGGAMLLEQDRGLAQGNEQVFARLERKQAFYGTHLAPGQFPAERVLSDKMALWMGRVSPPGLPESPSERLEKLDLVPTLFAHLKLVLAFARRTRA